MTEDQVIEVVALFVDAIDEGAEDPIAYVMEQLEATPEEYRPGGELWDEIKPQVLGKIAQYL